VDDFRALKQFPRSQVRVARYLATEDEELRKRLFNEPESKWRPEDTGFLRKIFQEKVSVLYLINYLQLNFILKTSFKDEVGRVILQYATTSTNFVSVPGLPDDHEMEAI
jgi:hypothetical protein